MKIIETKQGTDEWLKHRLWKVTWTKLKDVMWSNNLKLIDELLAEILTAEWKENITSRAMERGTDEEPHAIKEYEKLTGQKVSMVWFCISDEFNYLGLSPDWLISTWWQCTKWWEPEHIYWKWVEIKCPSSSKHIEYIRINRIPNEYKYQVINYFIVNEYLEELDFVSYDRRVLVKPLHIVNVKREDLKDEIEECKIALRKFKLKLDKYHEQIIF